MAAGPPGRRTGSIDDLRAWLTTVVGRICLDMLKARQARRQDQAGMCFRSHSWPSPPPMAREVGL